MYTIELKELMDDQMFEIFDFDMPFYCDSEQAKYEWQCKFLRKYAFYDINSETVARWKWMLETKLIEVMPYYTKLYETELKAKDIEFLLNKDYRETFVKETAKDTIENSKIDSNSSSTQSAESTNTSKVSNIDNGLGDVGLTQGKLTGMSEDKSNSSASANGTQGQTAETTGTDNQNENYILEGKGNIGTTSSAALLREWREVLIDVDRLLLDECKDLFLMVF